MNFLKNNKRGIIALPIVVLLTIIIVSIAIGLSTVSYNENVSSFGASKSAVALSYALSGVDDAVKRIARDKTTNTNYTLNYSGSDLTTACPSAGTSQECARVRIDYSANKSPSIITSEGTSGAFIRKLQVDVFVDSNGVITSRTATEIKTLPTISTAQAYPIATTSATLNGWVNPNGTTVYTWFRYSSTQPTQCNDSFGTKVAVSGTQTGSVPVSISTSSVTGLSSATTYYYCAIVGSGSSTPVAYGNIFRFTTL